MPQRSNSKPFEIRLQTGADTAEVLIFGSIGGFFGEVSSREVVQQIGELPATVKTINVKINSPGGVASDGIAIFNALDQHGARIVVDIMGAALSAAGYISQVGHVRRMAKNAELMVHEGLTGVWGNKRQLRKSLRRLENLDENMVQTFAEKTGLSRAEVIALMEDETSMTAQQAKENGFIDEITGDSPVALDREQYANVFACYNHPERFLSETQRERLADVLAAARFDLGAAAGGGRQPPTEPPEPKPMAETNQPQAATLDELKAAFPDAAADFLVAQLEAKATIAAAQTAYAAALQKQLAEQEAAHKAEIEAKEAAHKTALEAAQNAKVGGQGVDPLNSNKEGAADADGEPYDNPLQQFPAAVQAAVKAGKSMQDAVSHVVREQPELHQAYLREHNTRHGRAKAVAEMN